ncbi:MAG: BlaI/MecI/CopY family transcriptional regulator [Armatimonadota bacterium]
MSSSEGIKDCIGIHKAMNGQPLGELEAQVMDIIWNLEPPVKSSQVFKVMYPIRELTYSTIMLTMAKLARKGMLTQERTGDKKTDAFTYRPNITREQMGVALLNAVSHQVLGKSLDEGITMLCGGKLDAKGMDKLKELVAQDEAVEA